MEEEIVQSLSSFLVPSQQFNAEFENLTEVQDQCLKNMRRNVREWIALTLDENVERYSNESVRLGKLLLCQNVATMARLSRTKQDSKAFYT